MTPLSLACESGNADLVQELLKGGRRSPTRPLANGETPLMMAARTGRVPVIEVLLAKGREDRREGEAARHDRADVGRRELQRRGRASPDLEGRGCQRALRHHAAGSQALSRAAGPRPYPGVHRRPRPGRHRGRADAPDAKVTERPERAGRRRTSGSTKNATAAKRTLCRVPACRSQPSAAAKQWGGLTPLQFAVREGNLETVKVLLDAGADVNQTSEFGWTALLVATQNRYYKIGALSCSITAPIRTSQNEGGWTPLYLATDNRNIEGGDYPTRKPDMDHLDYIKRLLAAHANPNLRMRSSTETRTVFTHQWLLEDGATPFLRAAQSGDIVLMKLLLEHGADPKIATDLAT